MKQTIGSERKHECLFSSSVVLSDESKAKPRARICRRKLVKAFSNFFAVLPRRLFCFGSLMILDVARCYLWLFSLYINIGIGKIIIK